MQFWSRRQQQLQKEIQMHIDLEIDDNLRAGMSPKEARAAALKKFGNPLLTVERSREVWGILWLGYLIQDLRFALRSLWRSPGYAAAVVLTLALGLGSVATILAIMDSVLLRPLPLPHASQLVLIYGKSDQRGVWNDLSYRQIDTLRRNSHSFSAVSAYSTMIRAVGTPDGARWALYAGVSPGFFPMLGVPAKMGRLLNNDDVARSAVLISDDFWHERLHDDPHVIGSTLQISGKPRTIVGVLPPGLQLPFVSGGPAVYAPVSLQGSHSKGILVDAAFAFARLKRDVSRKQALAEVRTVLSHGRDANGVEGRRVVVESLTHLIAGGMEQPLLAMLGGVAILLLIACANAANLQIARATERLSEMQVRAALGASFPRLLQQLLTESLVLSFAGASVGAIFAVAATAAIRSAYGLRFARFSEIAVHPSVLAITAVMAVVAGLLASLAPAFAIRRRSVMVASQRTTTPRNRVSAVLVVLQMALTCVLLVTCGLFIRTFRALEQVSLGFDPHHVTTLVLMPQDSNQPPALLRQANALLLERFQSLPGVEAAAMQTSFPFSNYSFTMNGTTDVSGRAFQKGDTADYTIVSSDFIRASGIQLLRGRGFDRADDSSGAIAALVNQAFVHKYFTGRNPLGVNLQMHRSPGDKDSDLPLTRPMTIVGVVQNELQGQDLTAAPRPMIYLDNLQLPRDSGFLGIYGMMSQFALRSRLPQSVLDSEIRTVVRQAAPNMAEMQLQPMEKGIADSLGQRRLALRLVSSFGAIALLLAAVGLYGLLAYAVTLRRREIGIRMALGSSRKGVVRLIVRQAARMVAWGLLPGVAGARVAAHALRSFLFGVRPLDPLAVGASVAVLAFAGVLAATLPAWYAVRVDPVEVLRID